MMKNKCICRAKDIHADEWIYGYYVSKIDMLTGCDHSYILHQEYNSNTGLLDSFMTWREVDTNTVCRCTGLNDKQGNPIFEGDIITARYTDDGRLTKGVVNFLNGCFCVKYDNHNNPAIDMLCDYEISGDVFNNTELMEG